MADKDFFLSPDDAQTLGDINYMRKSKKVRRTFPKTLKNKDGFEMITDVSSVEDNSNLYNGNTNGNGQPNTTVFSTPTTSFQPQTFAQPAPAPASQSESNGNSQQPAAEKPQAIPAPQPVEKRRQQDDGMDMFRNMAKNIRKR